MVPINAALQQENDLYYYTYFQFPCLNIGVELITSCPRSCYGCYALAPLVKTEYVLDPEKTRKHIRHIAAISGIKLLTVELGGGEPMLHPDILEFFKITAEEAPQARNFCVTGQPKILFNKSDNFFRKLKETNPIIAISEYPDSSEDDIRACAAKLAYYDIRCYTRHRSFKEWDRITFSNYRKCDCNTHCALQPVIGYDDNLYRCCACNNACKDLSIFVPEHYQDIVPKRPIMSFTNFDELYKYASTPIEACYYCERGSVIKWKEYEEEDSKTWFFKND